MLEMGKGEGIEGHDLTHQEIFRLALNFMHDDTFAEVLATLEVMLVNTRAQRFGKHQSTYRQYVRVLAVCRSPDKILIS